MRSVADENVELIRLKTAELREEEPDLADQLEAFALQVLEGITASTSRAQGLRAEKHRQEALVEERRQVLQLGEKLFAEEKTVLQHLIDLHQTSKQLNLAKEDELVLKRERNQQLTEEMRMLQATTAHTRDQLIDRYSPADQLDTEEINALRARETATTAEIGTLEESRDTLITQLQTAEASLAALRAETTRDTDALVDCRERPERKRQEVGRANEVRDHAESLLHRAQAEKAMLQTALQAEGQRQLTLWHKGEALRVVGEETVQLLVQAEQRVAETQTCLERERFDHHCASETRETESAELAVILKSLKAREKAVDQLMKRVQASKHHLSVVKREAESGEAQLREVAACLETTLKDTTKVQRQTQGVQKATAGVLEQQELLLYTIEDITACQKVTQEEAAQQRALTLSLEQQHAQLKEEEAQALLALKKEDEVRGFMARQALSSGVELHRTEEELALRELHILNEKQQTSAVEGEVQRIKNLYESAKVERNKYVLLMQTASQVRAELREKFKAMEREWEVLSTHNREKERYIEDLRVKNDQTLQARDKLCLKLNKVESLRRKLEGNEVELTATSKKMLTIAEQLEAELHALSESNDDRAQQRDELGQTLIRVNKQLCLWYERSGRLRRANDEVQRRIVTVEGNKRNCAAQMRAYKSWAAAMHRRQAEMPELAEKVLLLKTEVEATEKESQTLQLQLEDPEDQRLFNELGGEDPDDQTLRARLAVLSEQLNLHKEDLLVTQTMHEQLRQKTAALRELAEGSRQGDLLLASKSCVFHTRLSQVSRKAMALVSELSTTQAMCARLAEEKQTREMHLQSLQRQLLGEADDSELQSMFERWAESEKRFKTAARERQAKEHFTKEVLPFAVFTTAPLRVDAYSDEIGLDKPYGCFKPFRAGPLLLALQRPARSSLKSS